MDLNSLIIIAKIARRGSFTAAAEALRMPNSNLSLKVKQLEQELGQPLFTRTTRKVVITEFGKKILQIAEPILGIEDSIRALSEESSKEPMGRIRITAPYDLGLHLLKDIIPQFTDAYPKVQVELDMSNAYVDIIERGFDFAIRATRSALLDSSIVAVKLGETKMHLYAHKKSTYVKYKEISQVESAPVLTFASGSIKITSGTRSLVLNATTKIIVKDMAGIRQATIGKAGVGILPDFICSDEQSRHVLTKIFPEWEAGSASFYALLPSRTSLTPKNQAFLDFIRSRF